MLRLAAITNFLPAARRALNVGVAETRACLRVDPAQFAFVDRFMYGRWGAALRIAVIVLPWWLLVFGRPFRFWLADVLMPGRATGVRRFVEEVLRTLIYEPMSLHFLGAIVLATGIRRALRSREWESQAATIPGVTDALPLSAVRSTYWMAIMGQVVWLLSWSAYIVYLNWRSGFANPVWPVPPQTPIGRRWIENSAEVLPALLFCEAVFTLYYLVEELFLMVLAVWVLLSFRQMTAGVAAWAVAVGLLSEHSGPYLGGAPMDAFVRWFGEVAGHVFLYATEPLGLSFLKLALAAAIVGHLRIVYDREGPGVGRRWR